MTNEMEHYVTMKCRNIQTWVKENKSELLCLLVVINQFMEVNLWSSKEHFIEDFYVIIKKHKRAFTS